ncbi:MAG: ABC transporter ATP-binding protein, partial [Phascolarctobacterium sp.]|nr:ABC transporter ATP-binding protein [Phascolarctobacterium sp.]
MLRIEDFSYRYQSRTSFTLKHINLQLKAGEMLLLAGRSGCGKSTLIKAISGLLGSDGVGEVQGRIYLHNEDITNCSPEKIGQQVGTVYQSPDDQLFAMTVADEVGFALENQGLSPEIIASKVQETLALVGLAGYENYSIHKLSGGQRQRLALASILITKPRLLILDEPVSQMNPQGVQSFLQLLLRLNREEKIAILMIEHRVNELYNYFSRLAVMDEGQVIYDGSMEKAWYALSERQNVGVREPQNVKLCRALGLQQLTVKPSPIVAMIRQKYQLVDADACVRPNKCLPEAILSAHNLSFTYPGSCAATLKSLSFELYKGEIVGLMGFNGAGKSTLMNLLGGLTKVQQGSI